LRHRVVAFAAWKKSVGVTVIDLPRRERVSSASLKVELLAGANLAAADWPSIADGRDLRMHVFQSREFLDVWLDTIGKASRIEPYLVVVRDGDGRPVLYLPLAIETKFNLRLLRFMDCGVADYNAPIVAADRRLSRQEFHKVWAEILARLPAFDVVDLKKIANDVDGAVNPLTYLDCTPFGDSGHAVALTRFRDQTDTRRSIVRLRRKLQGYAKGLSQIGETRFLTHPDASETARLTERLLEFKRRKYERTSTPDFLAAPGVEQFYREMTSPGRLGKISHLSALTVGDTVASAHLGFIGRGRLYYILIGYDSQFGRYGVGHLLLQHLIDQSVAQDFDTFDLGIGDASYKNKWATHRLALHSHERAVTAAGRFYLQMRRIRRLVDASGVRTWFRTAS
jgi:CelD/BcsL family acetyltransferase involved in cellulose biosynthesis